MLQIALLGAWHVHFDEYAGALAKQPDRVRLAGLWDSDAARGAQKARDYGIPFFADADALLAQPGLDGVVVCSATDKHPLLFEKAARAGLAVFTEKVLCITAADAYRVRSAIRAAGVQFCISFPWRTRPAMLYAERAVKDGLLGRITYVRMRNAHDGACAGWLPPHFYDAQACGGGAMMDLGAHSMYIIPWLLGRPAAVRSAFTHVQVPSVEDNAVSLLIYENGAIGVSETGFVSPHCPYALEISGTKGCLIAGGPDDTLRINVGRGWETPALPAAGEPPLFTWLDAIETGVPSPYTIDDAVLLSEVMDAAYRAAASGAAALPPAGSDCG